MCTLTLATLAASLVLTAVTVFGQSSGGTITGTVSDPDGHVIPTAVVQARNTTTGAVFQAVSAADGRFSLTLLPPATYDIAVPPIGYAMARFERKGVVVGASQTLRIDVPLPWGAGLGTPGDDVTILVRSRSPAPSGLPLGLPTVGPIFPASGWATYPGDSRGRLAGPGPKHSFGSEWQMAAKIILRISACLLTCC